MMVEERQDNEREVDRCRPRASIIVPSVGRTEHGIRVSCEDRLIELRGLLLGSLSSLVSLTVDIKQHPSCIHVHIVLHAGKQKAYIVFTE